MVFAVYKILRSAISSRYPFLTLTYHRERKILQSRGEAEAHSFFRSPDCRHHMNQMAQARALTHLTPPSPEPLSDSALPDITLCLVTYNSAEWVTKWAEAVASLNYPKSKLKISWVDNNSADNTVDSLTTTLEKLGLKNGLEKTHSHDNLGFGAGQNLAMKKAKTELVLIINPDAHLAPESLRNAVNHAMSDEGDISCWEFAQIPYEHPKYYDPVTLETSWNSHACVLMKRSAFLEVDGYDENLFLYGEDVELSYRLRAQGYRLRYLPKARIHHDTAPNETRRQDQMARSIAANLWIRRKYGTLWDRFTGLILIKKSQFSSDPHMKESLALAWKLYSDLKTSFYSVRRPKAFFPFNGWEYAHRRLGAFTSLDTPLNCLKNRTVESKPLVSIITRVHKKTPILNEAIRCVRNQTYPHIEHIIVFDGCEPIKDKTIKSVTSHRTGRSTAANKGAEAALGDYLLFLDYDDLIFADHIEGLVARLEDNPEAVCAYSYSWEAMTQSRETGQISWLGRQNKMETQFSPEQLALTNVFALQSVLIRREAFEKVGGFNIKLEYCEDWDLWRRLIKLGPFEPYKKLTSIYFTPASLRDRIKRARDMVTHSHQSHLSD